MGSKSGLARNLDKIGAERGFFAKVPPGHLYCAPTGHDFEHPRNDLPMDESLRDSILEEGFRDSEPISIWRQLAKGGEVTLNGTVLELGDALLLVNAGCRRAKSAFAAEKVLRKDGKLKRGDSYLVPVRDWSPIPDHGSAESQFFLSMQEDDSRPHKKDHSPRVVASILIRAHKWGASLADVQARAPRHYDDRTVEFLLRWFELPAKVQAALDEGVVTVMIDGEKKEKEVSINLLPTLLDPDGLVPRDEMFAILKQLVAAGKKHWKGASRWLGEQRKVAQATKARGEIDPLASDPDAPEEIDPLANLSEGTTSAPDAPPGKKSKKGGREPRGPASPPAPARAEPKRSGSDLPILVQQPTPKKRQELIDAFRAHAKATLDQAESLALTCAAAAIALSLGQDVQTIPGLPASMLDAVREVFSKKPPAKKEQT